MQPGKYIVIEGSDGTGKSTQVELLRNYLKQHNVKSIEFHEPEDTTLPITSELRAIIKDKNIERSPETNLLLFTIARHEIWHKRALPALKQGKWVVASRNYLSTLVYQGCGEGLDQNLIKSITRSFTDDRYLNPDGFVVLTLKDETKRLQRITSRDGQKPSDMFESRNNDFQAKVANGYLDISKNMNIPTIESDVLPNQLHKKILEELRLQVGKF